MCLTDIKYDIILWSMQSLLKDHRAGWALFHRYIIVESAALFTLYIRDGGLFLIRCQYWELHKTYIIIV